MWSLSNIMLYSKQFGFKRIKNHWNRFRTRQTKTSKDKFVRMIWTLWVINYDDMKWELFMIWNEYENEWGPLPYVVLLLSFDRIRIYFVTISYYEWQLSHDLGLSKTYLIGRHFENFFIKDFLRRIRYFNTWMTKTVIFVKKCDSYCIIFWGHTKKSVKKILPDRESNPGCLGESQES